MSGATTPRCAPATGSSGPGLTRSSRSNWPNSGSKSVPIEAFRGARSPPSHPDHSADSRSHLAASMAALPEAMCRRVPCVKARPRCGRGQ
eukprot:scaffold8767_cov121-Isochrysis_galbana.AAC.11